MKFQIIQHYTDRNYYGRGKHFYGLMKVDGVLYNTVGEALAKLLKLKSENEVILPDDRENADLVRRGLASCGSEFGDYLIQVVDEDGKYRAYR